MNYLVKAGTKAMICNSGEKICISNSSYYMKLMYQNELMVQFLQGLYSIKEPDK